MTCQPELARKPSKTHTADNVLLEGWSGHGNSDAAQLVSLDCLRQDEVVAGSTC